MTLRPLALALLLAAPAGAQTADPLVLQAFQGARDDCAARGGTLRLPADPVTWVDLTGDGTLDRIVSEEGAFCGPDLGYLGGSAGNGLHAIVGETVQTLPPGAWAVADAVFSAEAGAPPPPPRRLLILALHGSFCETYGAAPCTLSLAWDAGEGRLASLYDSLTLRP